VKKDPNSFQTLSSTFISKSGIRTRNANLSLFARTTRESRRAWVSRLSRSSGEAVTTSPSWYPKNAVSAAISSVAFLSLWTRLTNVRKWTSLHTCIVYAVQRKCTTPDEKQMKQQVIKIINEKHQSKNDIQLSRLRSWLETGKLSETHNVILRQKKLRMDGQRSVRRTTIHREKAISYSVRCNADITHT